MATPLTVHTNDIPVQHPPHETEKPERLETVIVAGIVLGSFLGLGIAYVATYGTDDTPISTPQSAALGFTPYAQELTPPSVPPATDTPAPPVDEGVFLEATSDTPPTPPVTLPPDTVTRATPPATVPPATDAPPVPPVTLPDDYVSPLYLPYCEQEDDNMCYWDATRQGNGQGRSFVTIDHETYYLP